MLLESLQEAWSEAPPETCEAFDSMNARVRRMFAAGALYRAALQDDQKELKLLLDGFPDALNESISDGASAAYAAAMKNHVEDGTGQGQGVCHDP